ncbi:MAG: TolC family protein [Planctomycetia bacterium]|nr:TolC family protein [Planctomycetia bacterium]
MPRFEKAPRQAGMGCIVLAAQRSCRIVLAGLACAGLWLGHAARLGAQQSDASSQRSAIIEFPNLGPVPGTLEPSLGPGPGSFEAGPQFPGGAGGTAGSGILGGRQRTGRIPRGKRPSALGSTIAANRGMQLPETIPTPTPARSVPIPATVIDAAILDDPGPADGLTLDAAIERMMASNLDIRALRHEITQADADVLTAGLRTNPLVYMDTQFIPYGKFNNATPGGPTQYDINITYPIDVSKKRQARTVVARMARSTIEAQFQDVTRRQIDNVYRAFVNLQAARVDVLTARATVHRQEQFLAELERSAKPGDAMAADRIDHLALVLERARSGLGDAVEAHADAQEGLAVLLGLAADEAPSLEPSGRLRSDLSDPPPLEELTAIALRCRPDLHAARIGVSRAGAEIDLQRANRFDDVYLFYDPFTYQNNQPFGQPSATSWAVGVTFALPIYNRNQGNIARAESNSSQTKLELASLERRLVSEVRLAEREYRRSRTALEQVETAILPRVNATLKRKTEQFTTGQITADDYEGHLDDAAEVAQSHRDALVRHRRSILDLNTAVGLRILP